MRVSRGAFSRATPLSGVAVGAIRRRRSLAMACILFQSARSQRLPLEVTSERSQRHATAVRCDYARTADARAVHARDLADDAEVGGDALRSGKYAPDG